MLLAKAAQQAGPRGLRAPGQLSKKSCISTTKTKSEKKWYSSEKSPAPSPTLPLRLSSLSNTEASLSNTQGVPAKSVGLLVEDKNNDEQQFIHSPMSERSCSDARENSPPRTVVADDQASQSGRRVKGRAMGCRGSLSDLCLLCSRLAQCLI
jgi:hypothetical protein